jgi:hypothetical protein
VSTYDASATALRPLMKMFWSAGGWREPPVPPGPAVMAQALKDGVLFRQPRSHTHDGWVTAARRAATDFSAAEVGDAFLESLSSRRLDLRSALASYAVARVFPEHEFATAPRGEYCVVCGQYPDPDEDVNVLNFERFKWGGVRHAEVRYVACDLALFGRAPRTGSTPADRQLGREVLEALRGLPKGAMIGKAAAALRMVPGNNAEREILAEILAIAGIWRTPARSSYRTAFPPPGEEAGDVDGGVDDEAVAEFLAGVG